MACGKPVVCSDIPSIRSLVRECKGILTVSPDDSYAMASVLIRLLKDDSKRSEMGIAGRKYVEQYHSWDVIAQKILDAIK
jgi:phosphatidylinositol alpha-1,6-mannosyltransferase